MNPVTNPDISNILNPPDLSLGQLVLHADPIVQAVLILLLLLSIWSWAVMAEKAIELIRARHMVKKIESALSAGQLPETLSLKRSHPLQGIFLAGVNEWQLGAAPGIRELSGERRERIERAMHDKFASEMRRMEMRLPFLATVGSAAPFIGLFGTVWGIMNSFTAIAQSHDTSLAVVAPGIAQALIGTAAGLAAAIPAVMAYNKFASELGRYAGRLQTLISTCGGMLVKRVAPVRKES
ncbi:MAG: MotA/TolQ/ExbB proton channel family protein [Gammaproteobacteria bacterium]